MSKAIQTAFRILLAALIIWLLVGCSSATNPGIQGSIENIEGNGPPRLKIGDTPIGPDQWTSPEEASAGESVRQDSQRGLQSFLDAWNLVDQEFYKRDAIDYEQMSHAAIKAMLDTLGDEETTLSDATTTAIAQQDLRGSFDGIGVTVEVKNKRLVIVSPIEDSPGAKAGLLPGDMITTIDDKDASNLSIVEAVGLIRGPRGTKVRLGITRETQPLTFEIVRSAITVVNVRGQMLDAKIAYLKVNQFSEPTGQLVQQKLTELISYQPQAIVLDLRNNPGGLLTAAINVASQFIDGGVVLHEQDRGEPHAISAQPGGLAANIPMVVLINKGSASAAEIVAGALQDRGRGVLVGERSFGKDTVQSVHPLGDGATISITVAKWFTPKKQEIAGKGLVPDVQVPLTEEDVKAGRDPQLDRARLLAAGGNR